MSPLDESVLLALLTRVAMMSHEGDQALYNKAVTVVRDWVDEYAGKAILQDRAVRR